VRVGGNGKFSETHRVSLQAHESAVILATNSAPDLDQEEQISVEVGMTGSVGKLSLALRRPFGGEA
jgi:hypothetical protein